LNNKRYFIDGAESELRAQHNSSRRVSFLDGQMIGNARQDYKGVSARVAARRSLWLLFKGKLYARVGGKRVEGSIEQCAFSRKTRKTDEESTFTRTGAAGWN